MTAPTVEVKSPAKLNLFLHITGRRADGYHELQTLFQLLDLHDLLRFSLPAEPGLLSLRCGQPEVPLESNLILRAARLLREHCKVPDAAASIELDKRIPLGAGLGGGSSNAALTLVTLNRLWQTGLDRDSLCALGLQLGADVPLFIQGRSALATGVGEILEPLDLPAHVYLLVWPGVTVSTAEIFSRPELTRQSPTIKIADFLAGRGRNDCEPVVRKLYPQVDAALNWLSGFSLALTKRPARMTGTGSCVFAPFSSRTEAERVLAEMPKQYRGFIANGINAMP